MRRPATAPQPCYYRLRFRVPRITSWTPLSRGSMPGAVFDAIELTLEHEGQVRALAEFVEVVGQAR